MDFAEMLKWLGVLLVGSGGGLLTNVIAQRGSFRVKKLDEAGEIRKELREQVGKLNADVAALNKEIRLLVEQNEQARVHIADLQIALRRYVSRVEECAEVINRLLEVEEHLDAGHVRRARAILKLVEADRWMRKQMHLEDEEPEKIG